MIRSPVGASHRQTRIRCSVLGAEQGVHDDLLVLGRVRGYGRDLLVVGNRLGLLVRVLACREQRPEKVQKDVWDGCFQGHVRESRSGVRGHHLEKEEVGLGQVLGLGLADELECS